jgi:hypothetical protein
MNKKSGENGNNPIIAKYYPYALFFFFPAPAILTMSKLSSKNTRSGMPTII